jgi:hypothetical protein
MYRHATLYLAITGCLAAALLILAGWEVLSGSARGQLAEVPKGYGAVCLLLGAALWGSTVYFCALRVVLVYRRWLAVVLLERGYEPVKQRKPLTQVLRHTRLVSLVVYCRS